MNLDLPIVSSTPGPSWAAMLNTLIALLDAHDHTSGKGVTLNPSAMNVNVNYPFNNQQITGARGIAFQDQGVSLGPIFGGLQVSQDELWWRNATGVSNVQITLGGTLNIPSGALRYKLVSTQTYTVIAADANNVIGASFAGFPKTFTMPAANIIAAGMYFVVRDVAGDAGTNPISFTPIGSDKINNVGPAASPLINTNGGVARIISDGVSRWWTV